VCVCVSVDEGQVNTLPNSYPIISSNLVLCHIDSGTWAYTFSEEFQQDYLNHDSAVKALVRFLF
jgi:hypothetical protein